MNPRIQWDFARSAASKFPETRVRFMLAFGEVTGVLGCQSCRVQFHAAGFGFAQHPFERDIRKTPFIVPSADIAVDTRKPDLLQGLMRVWIVFVPEAGGKSLRLSSIEMA